MAHSKRYIHSDSALGTPQDGRLGSVRETLLVVFLASILGAMSSQSRADWHHAEAAIMGTSVSVTLWSNDAAAATQAITLVMAEMRRLDAALSTYNPASLVSKVNREAGSRMVEITPELASIIDKSLYYSQLSDGAFDISYASVGKHYDYRLRHQPDAAERDALLPAINYDLIKLDAQQTHVRFANLDLQIGLGGIAKGYAVDRCITLLQELGITSASISAGGDSRVLGDKRGKPWLVGIKNPRGRSAEDVAITLPLVNVAISTSGDYERFFFDAQTQTRIHHILNPRTGTSVSGIASVSIIGPLGFDTDPLSTTVFVLGVEKGLALINGLEQFDAVIIDAAGVVHYSNGLEPAGEPLIKVYFRHCCVGSHFRNLADLRRIRDFLKCSPPCPDENIHLIRGSLVIPLPVVSGAPPGFHWSGRPRVA